MELFYAGFGWGAEIVLSWPTGSNRLLSFINDKKRIELFLEVLKNMQIFMAEDTSGFNDIKPEQIIKQFNILLSYEHPKGKDSTDKAIKEIKEEVNNGSILGRS